MLETVVIIVSSVTIFGVLFFLLVKRAIKKRLDNYISNNEEKNN